MKTRAMSVVWLMLCVVVTAVAADRAHEATVISADGEARTVYVFAETFDGLSFAQDPEATKAQGTMPWPRISAVEYVPTKDIDYSRGLGAYNQQDFAKAIQLFQKVVAEGRTEQTRIIGIEALIKACEAGKKAADGAAAIDAFVAAHAKNPKIVNLLYEKGRILLASGDLNAAAAAFDDLKTKSRGFGAKAADGQAMAAAGVAQVQLAKKDAAAAAATVKGVLDSIDRDGQPDAYAFIGIVGVRAMQEQGDVAAAQALAKDLQYLGSDVNVQVEAHLRLAEMLEGSDMISAFDHAAIASIRGQGSELGQKARLLARSLATAISKDESRTEAERITYKNYLGSL